ncbi:MAG: hypothetical protein ACUVWR_17100 [Anaerolineae bacterium]
MDDWMRHWFGQDARRELHEMMHELRHLAQDIERLIHRQARHVDPEKLRRIREIISGAYRDIETVLREQSSPEDS